MAEALTTEQVRLDLGQLESNLGVRNAKYIRNYNRYVSNGTLKDQIDNIDTNPPQGFWYNSAQSDTGPIPLLNVLRSMIDTICSKLAQTRVRPFFNPVQGTWETRKACRAALQFFDLYFDNQHIFEKAIDARRDSLVFEDGCLWVNDDVGTIERIAPWQFLFDRAEMNYGKLTRCAVVRKSFPLGLLADAPWLDAHWKSEVKRNRIQKHKVTFYYDLVGGRKTYWVDDAYVGDKPIEFTCSPVVWTFYSRPIKGAFSTSLIDNQYTIQTLIDLIAERIELAVELSPANLILLPEGSHLKRSSFTNEIGAAYEYLPQPFLNAVPQVVTPAPINPEYLEILKYAVELAYNLEGVSQLSAQSVKPSGLDSGVALQTVQNVESERFETLLQEHIRFLMEVTSTAIDVFPPNADLLPRETGRAKVKWSDVKKQRELFSIQFAPASALSKDPQTKMQQVQQLIEMKVVPPEEAAEYLEFPDMERLQSSLTAVQDVIEHIVERAIEKGIYEYDSVVPGDLLEQAVLRELYRLDSIDEVPEVMDRIRELYKRVRNRNQEMQDAENPPAQPQMPMIQPAEAQMPQQIPQATPIVQQGAPAA